MRDKLLESLQNLDFDVKTGVETPPPSFVSTGNVALDWAVSARWQGGGLPVGRVVEVFGDPSTGKSLLVSHLLASVQQAGGLAVLDDVEQAFDPTFAAKTGVDLRSLILLDSETVQEHFENITKLVNRVRSQDKDIKVVIALDSLALLSTEHEKKEGFEKVDMTKAKMIRQGMRMIGKKFTDEGVLYVCCNHVIANVGVMYGPKTTTPGGSGIPFQSSVRIEMNGRGLILNEKKKPIGVRTLAKVVKNKIAPPFREVELQVSFESGVSRWSGMFQLLLDEEELKEETDGWYVSVSSPGKKKRRSEIEESMEQYFSAFMARKNETP